MTQRPPSAYQVLMQELDAHGVLTYRDLTERWGDKGYTRESFSAAAYKARKLGLIESGMRGRIVKAKCCPCCGREL